MAVVDLNSAGMPVLRQYDLSGGGSNYTAQIVNVENTDRFLHTSDGLDICIISVSEGKIHFCMYTKTGAPINHTMKL